MANTAKALVGGRMVLGSHDKEPIKNPERVYEPAYCHERNPNDRSEVCHHFLKMSAKDPLLPPARPLQVYGSFWKDASIGVSSILRCGVSLGSH